MHTTGGPIDWKALARRAHAATAAGHAEAEPLRLDQEANNSPEGLAELVPDRRGGKLDPEGGKGLRVKDLRKFEALVRGMSMPVLLTLTMDREAFPDPAAAYRKAMPQVSDLLTERLGVRVWGRVIEVQSNSGDGWVHWHVVADMAGTTFDLSASKGRPWVDLQRLQAEVKKWWCLRWRLGQPAGQDIQLVKSREGIVGYLAGYLIKAWPAIPVWVLERSMMRLVGFSREANRLFRACGLTPERSQNEGQQLPPQRRRRRPVGRLGDRLPASGLTTKVLLREGGKRRFLGRLNAPSSLVSWLSVLGVGVRKAVRVAQTYFGPKDVAALVLEGATASSIERVNGLLERFGFTHAAELEYAERRTMLWNSWAMMQAEEESLAMANP